MEGMDAQKSNAAKERPKQSWYLVSASGQFVVKGLFIRAAEASSSLISVMRKNSLSLDSWKLFLITFMTYCASGKCLGKNLLEINSHMFFTV